MNKPVVHPMPNAETRPDAGNRTEPVVIEKVALIVEHSAYRIDEEIISELCQLVPPAQTELSLVHLLVDVTVGLPLRHNHMQDLVQSLEERQRRQEAAQREFRTRLEQHGFSMADERTYAMNGQTVSELIEYINDSGQELAVFCADQYPAVQMGRSPFFMQFIAHLPVSELILKRHFAMERDGLNVLLAVDDSDASLTAVRKLPGLLRTNRLNVTLATVQSPIYQDNAMLAPFVNQDVLDEALASNADMIFEMSKDILEAQGVTVRNTKRLMGSPAAELGYLAQTEQPDLIVVGSHNRTGVMAWLMGSVSSQLLHWDTHNLLIVR